MNYKVKFIPKFEKELKRLAKKFPSLKADFSLLLQSLRTEPAQGTALGNECYKINHNTVYLLTIFDTNYILRAHFIMFRIST